MDVLGQFHVTFLSNFNLKINYGKLLKLGFEALLINRYRGMGGRNLKRMVLAMLLIAIILLQVGFVYSAINIDLKNPWIYPATIQDPTTSENYTVPITSGVNNIDLIMWNNHPNWDFVSGKFVIAIKSGLAQVSINNVSLTKETEDLSGISTPGNFSLNSIFPCPWIQYNVSRYLADMRDPKGYQGVADTSGIQVSIQISVIGDPADVKLYFLAWGNKFTEDGLYYTDSPISHITETIPQSPATPTATPTVTPVATVATPVTPEFSPIMIIVLLFALSGVFVLVRKNKHQNNS